MKAIINGSTLTLDEMQLLNSGSINYYEMELETTEEWNDTTKKAIIIKDGEATGVEIPVVEDVARIDRTNEGKYYIGFVGYRSAFALTTDTAIVPGKTYYTLDNGVYTIVANPVVADIGNYYESVITYKISTNLVVLVFDRGAGNVEVVDVSSEIPPANVFESYIAQVNEVMRGASFVDIDVAKVEGVATVTITNRLNQTKSVNILDGAKGDKGDNGTNGINGVNGADGQDGVSPTVEVSVNTEGEYRLNITDKNGTITTPNLVGPKGDTGANGQNGRDGVDGQNGTNGQNGADGYSPTVTVNTSTSTTYTLDITDKNGTITTPNLKGQDGSSGTTDYTNLANKPQIAGTTLTGNKSLSDLGIADKSLYGDTSINLGRETGTTAGINSNTLGEELTASAYCSNAIGLGCVASGNYGIATGEYTTASAEASFSGGMDTVASGIVSFAFGEGGTASGESATSFGAYTKASRKDQIVVGKYNVEDTTGANSHSLGDYAEIVGNGTSDNSRSNARTTDWSGNGWYAGNIKIGGTSYSDINAKELVTKEYIDSLVSQGAEKTILYNGKANNTAILNDVTQELPESIHNFDLIIVGTNAQITPTLRSMEVTQVIYPHTDLITYCDATGTGANGVWQVFNCNTNYTSSGNAYRVMFGFTDATHIRNVLGTPVNSWTNPGICYVVGYKFKAVVLPGGNNVYDVVSISDNNNWESATIEPSINKLKASATTIKAQLDEIKTTLTNGRNVSFEEKNVTSGGELHTSLQHKWVISSGGGISMFVVTPDINDNTKNYTYIMEAPAGYEEITGVWLKNMQL